MTGDWFEGNEPRFVLYPSVAVNGTKPRFVLHPSVAVNGTQPRFAPIGNTFINLTESEGAPEPRRRARSSPPAFAGNDVGARDASPPLPPAADSPFTASVARSGGQSSYAAARGNENRTGLAVSRVAGHGGAAFQNTCEFSSWSDYEDGTFSAPIECPHEVPGRPMSRRRRREKRAVPSSGFPALGAESASDGEGVLLRDDRERNVMEVDVPVRVQADMGVGDFAMAQAPLPPGDAGSAGGGCGPGRRTRRGGRGRRNHTAMSHASDDTAAPRRHTGESRSSAGEGASHPVTACAADSTDAQVAKASRRKPQASTAHCERSPKSVATTAGEITTLMVRGLPPNLGRQALADRLREEGFGDKFDFLYVPMNFDTASSYGYAFVNFVSADAAGEFLRCWQCRRLADGGDAGYETVAAAQVQGKAANVSKAKGVRLRRILNPDFLPLVVGPSEGNRVNGANSSRASRPLLDI